MDADETHWKRTDGYLLIPLSKLDHEYVVLFAPMHVCRVPITLTRTIVSQEIPGNMLLERKPNQGTSTKSLTESNSCS
jgi:hypothetical protein